MRVKVYEFDDGALNWNEPHILTQKRVNNKFKTLPGKSGISVFVGDCTYFDAEEAHPFFNLDLIFDQINDLNHDYDSMIQLEELVAAELKPFLTKNKKR